MSTILTSESDVDWLPKPNHVEFILDSALADPRSITGVYVFAFQHGRLLLVLHAERGWDLPGADAEVGDAPEAALARAVLAGAGAELCDVVPLGCFRIRLPQLPSESRVQIFVAGVQALLAFFPAGDLRERKLFTTVEAENVEVLRQYAAVYQAALAVAGAADG